MHSNPFLITGYQSEELFCNREPETSLLINNTLNGNNMTLISPRRMGKTGLILHAFKKLSTNKQCETLYVDIFATRSLSEFIKALSEAMLNEFNEKTSLGKKFWNFVKGLRPLITYDPLSGVPQVQINYQTEGEKQQTLRHLLRLLENHNKRIIVAIDEFQQIREYPEDNIEALLRTEIQHMQNVSFIFCGSKRHMMIDIFSNNKKPFYASTQFLFLEEIESKHYTPFIKKLFEENGRKIEQETIEFILKWTKNYTYYTQSVCNKIYASQTKKITVETVKNAIQEILELQTPVYHQLRDLLTTAQWNYLIAIAKEDRITQITAQDFLMKHQIGTASNSTRLMKSLVDKELILETILRDKKEYAIYDVFFSHWLKNNY